MEIRTALIDELAAITDIYNYYIRETAYTFDLDPFKAEDRVPWFAQFSAHGPHRIIVADDGGKVAGYACSARVRQKDAYLTSVETTVYLQPDGLGSGIGSTLYKSLFDAISGENVHRAYGVITLPNDPSIALHEKFGFETLGVMTEVGRKFDQFWDVAWMEKKL